MAKTLSMVSLSLLYFNVLGGQECYALGHCEIERWPTDPNINRNYELK